MTENYSMGMELTFNQSVEQSQELQFQQIPAQMLTAVLEHTPAYDAFMKSNPDAEKVKDNFVENLEPAEGGLILITGWSRNFKSTLSEGIAAHGLSELKDKVESTGRNLHFVHITGGEGIPLAYNLCGLPFNGDYSVMLERPEIGKAALALFVDKVHKAMEANDSENTVVTVAEYMPLPPVLSLLSHYYHAAYGLLTNPEIQKIGSEIQEAINKHDIEGVRQAARKYKQKYFRTALDQVIMDTADKQGNLSAVEVSVAIGSLGMARLANEEAESRMAKYKGRTFEDFQSDSELREEAEPIFFQDQFELYGAVLERSFIGKPEVIDGNISHPKFRKRLKPLNL